MEIVPGSNEEKLTEGQLKWGLWWVNHRGQLKTAATILLGTVAFVLLAYGSWGFADWFFGSGVRERAGTVTLTQNLTDYTSFREAAMPEKLSIQPTMTLPAGEGKYDLLARMINPNRRWWVEFDFRFVDAGLSDRLQHGYLLPTDSRFLYQLGVSSDHKPSPTFEITDITWHRVDGHEVQPDYLTWATKRLNFIIDRPEFVPPDAKSALPVSRARFSVTNDTAFSYVSVPFLVTLLSGERVVAVNRVVVTGLKAGEIREVESSWFNDLPSVTRVEVKLELNIFDSTVYLAPES
ncbi:hypothetical protein A2480_01275 [Candidatus Uhrbacteria bacterium RIFOXYC2_FULL_47_19]|uniref:Uncharacterized protein n=1 Tax=Candidatus Uhrbacteria bacterium RIFOXYC2_FULL_47_19 TaxID=1802424 RepID=A0A1F7WDC3_9BACT|nr:MAG: hypothetical protein A2480_01275 [Candidatus Uhrbacteria bacterium RIFOXYC2_FULL_47_19]HCC22412.1 hypothetical protein [Candidatus Uhrbacteria bacterium]